MKMSEDILKVNEIYYSIQGESSLSGRKCIFIRLTYCNLRCSYCDSEYAFYKGNDMTIPGNTIIISNPSKMYEQAIVLDNCIAIIMKVWPRSHSNYNQI